MGAHPKVIFFDLDDTLYDAKNTYEEGLKRAWSYFSEHSSSKLGLKLDWDGFVSAYDNARAVVKQRSPSKVSSHNRILYFKELVETHIKSNQPDLILNLDRAYMSALSLHNFAPVSTMLVRLALNSKLAVITNQLAHTQLDKLRHLDPKGILFKRVITSEDAGFEKPNSKIFELALKLMDVSAHDALMVGDDWIGDIEGAKNVGMKAVYCSPSPPPEGSQTPWISNILELAQALERI